MEYYILDTETTGLKPGYHEFTEISIIRCKDLVQKTWNVKIKYPDRCEKRALEVTNKTVKQLLNKGKYIEEVILLFNKFLEEDGVTPDQRVCVAHNSPFDSRFLIHVWKEHDYEFPIVFWECTLSMSKYFNKKNKLDKIAKLDDMLKKLNIKGEIENTHSSGVDCRNTFRLRNYLIKNGVEELQFIKATKEYIENKNTNKAKEDEVLEEDPAMNEIFDF